jgi:hypothetical protein
LQPVLDVRRPDFITLLAGAAAAWPLIAFSQQAERTPVVGFFASTSLSASRQFAAAFRQGSPSNTVMRTIKLIGCCRL